MRISGAATVGLFLCAGAAQASVFTAGPGGAYATLQSALNAATFATGDNEVRVRAGSYAERVTTGSMLLAGESLTVTGGWDASFTSRQTDPSTTVIDGGGAGRVLDLSPAGGMLVIEGFTIRNGHHVISGGGIHGIVLEVSGGRLILQNNVIEDSSAEDGGGVFVAAEGTGEIVVTNNTIRDNEATARGGGLSVRALGDAAFTVRDNRIEGNLIDCCSVGNGSGAGVFVKLQERPIVDFSDNLIQGNQAIGPDPIQGDGGALWLFAGDPDCDPVECTSATLTARRNRWIDNTGSTTSGFRDHLSLRADSGTDLPSSLDVSDSIVSGGNGVGVAFFAFASSTLQMTNLTVVEHSTTGILQRGVAAEATTTLYNTIAYGNQPETLISSPATGSNLVGVDPLFVDPTADDYGLEPGSPAIDAGDDAPPGDLGPFDVEGSARIQGAAVNIGAVERVPEPGRLLLQASALAVLAGFARHRQRSRGAREAERRARRLGGHDPAPPE